MTETILKFPGYSDSEIDASIRDTVPTGNPAAIVGAMVQGPAFVPTIIGSLSDQIAKFGPVTPGYPATYASQRWLENRNSAVIVRLLGAGANSNSGDFNDTKTKGIVKNAGFFVSGSQVGIPGDFRHNGSVQFLVGKHALTTKESYGFPIFTDNDSYNAGSGYVNLVRGMILCSSGSRIMVLDGTGESFSDLVDDIASIDSGSNSVTKGKFKLVVSTSLGASFSSTDSSPGVKILTASFNPSDSDYFSKILNTNPDKFFQEGHYLYADFPVDAEIAAIASGASNVNSVAIISGSAATTSNGGITNSPFRNLFGRFDTRYSTPKTPMIISQPFGNIEYDLFNFETISDGDNANRMVKISIAGLKASSDPLNEYGSFTVIVRDFNDTDFNPQILEQFTNVNLDKDSDRYIAKIIGDIKAEYRFDFEDENDRGVNITGTYPNKSKFIRVRVSDGVATKTLPAKCLPFGFKGIPTLKTADEITDSSGTTRIASSGSIAGSPIVPPIPFRFKITRGDVSSVAAYTGQAGTTEIVDGRLYWGIKFERNTEVTNTNIISEKNELIPSYGKLLGISKLDTLFTGSFVDTFNNNKFSLSKVVLPTTTVADLTASVTSILKDSAYIRNGVPDGTNYTITDGTIGARITLASVLQKGTAAEFNRFSEYSKFTTMFYGGFDGVNILDKEARKFTDRSTSIESGVAGYGGASSNYISPGFSSNMNGVGDANNQVNSYKTAIRIITDPLTSPMYIMVLPGQREPLVTDYAAQKVADFGRAFYIMDIPVYDSDSIRIFDGEINRFIDNQKTAQIFDSRAIDNGAVAVYHPSVTIEDPLNEKRTVVPASVAALAAFGFNDRVTYPWYAAAGLNRGALTFVKAVSQKTKAQDKNVFSDTRINPIIKDEGLYVLYSQFTLKQGSNVLTSRINIKRLSIEISRMLANIGYPFIFENQTPALRENLKRALENRFSILQQAKAISAFQVVCDNTNNTDVDRENHKINVSIKVRPIESLEYVVLDFVITRSGTFLIT
jgi:hypothetical protein